MSVLRTSGHTSALAYIQPTSRARGNDHDVCGGGEGVDDGAKFAVAHLRAVRSQTSGDASQDVDLQACRSRVEARFM